MSVQAHAPPIEGGASSRDEDHGERPMFNSNRSIASLRNGPAWRGRSMAAAAALLLGSFTTPAAKIRRSNRRSTPDFFRPSTSQASQL